jgi:hypothetical protein
LYNLKFDQVEWAKQDTFKTTHILRLGGFRAMSCFVASISKLWGDGGLKVQYLLWPQNNPKNFGNVFHLSGTIWNYFKSFGKTFWNSSYLWLWERCFLFRGETVPYKCCFERGRKHQRGRLCPRWHCSCLSRWMSHTRGEPSHLWIGSTETVRIQVVNQSTWTKLVIQLYSQP